MSTGPRLVGAAPSLSFAFLSECNVRLLQLARLAERYLQNDPNTALIKLRQFGEVLATDIAARAGGHRAKGEAQAALLKRLELEGVIQPEIGGAFHTLRVAGNEAAHLHDGDYQQAAEAFRVAHELATWFHSKFGIRPEQTAHPAPVESRAEQVAAARAERVSCILDASAGTGKTTQLVRRIVDVLASGVRPENVVAVTFTNAAAGEMKLRVRQKLEEELKNASPETAGHLQTALGELERAFIGTIHSFCAHLIRQRPVEARVDPAFEELAAPERVFARVFHDWLVNRLQQGSPTLRRCFARLTRSEERSPVAPLDRLRFEAWKLAEWRDHDAAWQRNSFDRPQTLEAAFERVRAFSILRNRCDRPQRDILYQSFQPLADFVERIDRTKAAGERDYDASEADLLALPRDLRWINKGAGTYAEKLSREQLLTNWEELKTYIEDVRSRIDADFVVDLRDELWQVVERYGEAKARAGQLDFLDLLLSSKRLLDHEDARAYFQARYPYIFIDEFQDTDPVQAEVLRRIWKHPVIAGDRKQSIYRFRRADVQQYQRICEQMSASGANTVQLANCARSTTPIQDFVNVSFAGMAEYLPLRGGREPKAGQPSLIALPMPRPYGVRNLSKLKINECSPATVAAFIEWLVKSSGYSIWDKDKCEYRPVCAGDACILFRRFTNNSVDLTQDYVRALEARGVAHVLIGSKSFHQREEVSTIRTALRAIEWPEDELSLYATLRNIFGVLDSTLFKFRERDDKKRLRYFGDLPPELDPEYQTIADAYAMLRELHRQRNGRPIAQTINDLLTPIRGFSTLAFRKGGKRVLANVYRLLDIARSYELTEATSFRSFIDYLEEQAEGGEAKEAPILEQEGDAVKLINVHKAKGLEFPVVILADLTANLVSPEGSGRYVDSDQRLCAQRLLGCAPQALLDHMEEENDAERDEAIRLAYVAATRARDLLVVSAVGDISFTKKAEFYDASWLSPLYPALYPSEDRWCHGRGITVLNAPQECGSEMFIAPGMHVGQKGGCEVLWFDPAKLDLSAKTDGGLENEAILNGTPEQKSAGVQQYRAWHADRESMIRDGMRPRFRVVEATSVGAELPDLPEPERIKIESALRRARGRQFGRVVHRIMQNANVPIRREQLESLAAGKEISAEDSKAAVELAIALFDHEILRTAFSSGRFYRELPIAVRLPDGRLAEGRADLVFFDGARWTVIDFKTGSPEDRDERQVQIYAYALSIAKKQPVRAVIVEV